MAAINFGITVWSMVPSASAIIHLIVVLATLVVGVYSTFMRGATSVLRVSAASEVSVGNGGMAVVRRRAPGSRRLSRRPSRDA